MELTRISGRGALSGLVRNNLVVGLVAAVATTLVGVSAEPVHAVTGGPARTTPTPGPIAYSNGRPRDARLSIPAVRRIHRVPVVAYRGKTDDGPGTRIQNRGIAASPYGPQGGTGPGGIGNYQITAHRTSHGGIFGKVPSLHRGDRVYVDAGRWRYVYVIVATRWVSFRSAKSLRQQRAAVPGHPGRTPTHGYITLSTCATPEDHARGNYWSDRYGNPEHRIDKVGRLVKRARNPHWRA